nr:YchJ family metal-binding protein [Colwellia sp. C1TZA3]
MATKSANSPEQLMRSRYSAYATQQADYIYFTYAHSSQAEQSIDDIAQWAATTKWLKLVIHYASDHKKDLAKHNNAQVEFSAFYQLHGQIWQMREKSNFVLEDTAWRYLDGEVSDSKTLNKPKRNESCFCGSEKKFKNCCAKVF